MNQYVARNLEQEPPVTGLTFGVERGSLLRFVMMGRFEYVGRALNVACRLQSAIKDKDERPNYKVLFSRSAFNHLDIPKDKYRIKEVSRHLRNIRGGGRYQCIKLSLPV